MPKKRKYARTTFSLNIKRGKRFVPIPRYTKKQKKDILLNKKKTPSLYAVKRKAGRVVEAKKV